ncbi:hypothetical protein RA276_33125, partial [Pseudomonas syringae pv. tagetis]|uniref:hypothetical protein n=1 Tax=Pseudomonas syringae group genomosp. 7 TaxID=251699 RepID=UPI00376FC898
RSLDFRDVLPTTNVGKFLGRELRDEEFKKLGVKKKRGVSIKSCDAERRTIFKILVTPAAALECRARPGASQKGG